MMVIGYYRGGYGDDYFMVRTVLVEIMCISMCRSYPCGGGEDKVG